MKSDTPETDAHWEPVKGSAFWESHPTRLKMEELERRLNIAREALADMLMDHKPYGSAQLARFRKANAAMAATERSALED